MDKFKKYLVFDEAPEGYIRRVYKFPNDYGASVTNYGEGTDIAVVKFDGDIWIVDMTTPVASDILINVKDKDIEGVFEQIRSLKNGTRKKF